MRLNTITTLFLALLVAAVSGLQGQTIAEKKEGIYGGSGDLTPEMQKFLVELNRELNQNRESLKLLYAQVFDLYRQNAPQSSYRDLLVQINDIKENIRMLEESWREMATQSGMSEDSYALWHQPETTIEQLVIDFGSNEHVYMIPPDIGAIKLSISSNIPIPAASWPDMLELILSQNGVGVRKLNPFLRELYSIKSDHSDVRIITSDKNDLNALPPNARIAFVMTPEPADVGRVWFFLDKFVNSNTIVLENLGRVILAIGRVSELKEISKIYEFILVNKQDLRYKIIPLFRVEAEEMANIVGSIFAQFEEEQQQQMEQTRDTPKSTKDRTGLTPPSKRSSTSTRTHGAQKSVSLTVIPLTKIAQAVFLVGTEEEIEKAEDIIKSVEGQIGEATEKVIYHYTVQHSDPEEMAQVLSKIYQMMVQSRIGMPRPGQPQQEGTEQKSTQTVEIKQEREAEPPLYQTDVYRPGAFLQGGYAVNPAPFLPQPEKEKREVNQGRDNFIVDLKSNSIVMVVEAPYLDQLKDLIKKLDVPKKMVQIDVLLFERRLKRDSNYGLNLLKIGSCASQTRRSCFGFNNFDDSSINSRELSLLDTGITRLLFSREKNGNIPAFDIAYSFLMSTEDITLNASPSVVAINQTEAVIQIEEEISISTGTFEIPQEGTGGALKDSFVRVPYGITIKVTPTVHMHTPEDRFGDQTDYVTLQNDIIFDTFTRTADDRPPVNRRHITNEVRIPDGENVIIGGLRRKGTDDKYEKVPFLGEIPGLGKLFSSSALSSDNVEIIIFLKPSIIKNPTEDFRAIRRANLCKRPGDIPEFLCRLNQAADYEVHRHFQGTMEILFGRRPGRCIGTEGEYKMNRNSSDGCFGMEGIYDH